MSPLSSSQQPLLQDEASLSSEHSKESPQPSYPTDHDEVDDDYKDSHPSQKRRRTKLIMWLVLQILIACLATWGAIDLSHRTWTHLRAPNPTPSCYCGTTPSEAIRRGCGYDHILGAWIPPHCQDRELSKIYDEMGRTENHSWVYYDYPDRKRQLTHLQVSMLAGIGSEMGSVSVTEDWHMSHCLYLWLRLSRKDFTGTVMTERDSDSDHAMHCVKVILANLLELSFMKEVIARSGVWMFPEIESQQKP